MSNARLHKTRNGDERLMQDLLIVYRLCAESVSASERLEAKLGMDVQSLIVPLPRRGATPKKSKQHLQDAGRGVAAA